ncbi:hypothetical protein RHGRI_014176 [Rhododendron griersonianum]|uniref:Uncharacterized protein n=1 Tax=Rhododendron griersonianum TaxID=479676 RepID=A0AAV6K8E8_9ERIC|nr:hypothetical protein RHGRI_014176 [Rhododendron griersonianum]
MAESHWVLDEEVRTVLRKVKKSPFEFLITWKLQKMDWIMSPEVRKRAAMVGKSRRKSQEVGLQLGLSNNESETAVRQFLQLGIHKRRQKDRSQDRRKAPGDRQKISKEKSPRSTCSDTM